MAQGFGFDGFEGSLVKWLARLALSRGFPCPPSMLAPLR